MQTQALVPHKSKIIEARLYNLLKGTYGVDDGGLSEEILHLFENGNEELGYHYPELMVQLMAISSHPAVQELLPKYIKPNIGKYLQKLYDFFKCLDHKNFYLYLAYVRVKDYGSNMTDEELDEIEKWHLKAG